MAKKKSLQRVTEIDNLNSKKQVREFLENNPDSYEAVIESLTDRANASYNKKEGQDYKLMNMIYECFRFRNDEEGETNTRNCTYELNHYLITSSIHNFVLEKRTFPTIQHIAEETGLSRTTIYRHLEDGLNNDYSSLVKGKLEIMATKALEKLYLIGVQDNNAAALKNFLELSGAIAKHPVANINNYIQINNLRISKEELEQLPNDVVIQIEQLISENLKIHRINT